MDQEKRNWHQDRENVRDATGELVFLIDWIMHHPEQAGMLAIEIHEMARRYTENPTPDVEFSVSIPIAVWRQFVGACITEEASNLNEEACFHKAEDLLFKALQDFIALSKPDLMHE